MAATSGKQPLLDSKAQSDVDMNGFKLVNLDTSNFPAIINTTLDTDGTLSANSDTHVASQKATKTYADTKVTGVLDTDGTLAANSDAKVASQKATKTYADTKVTISTGNNYKFVTTGNTGLVQQTTVTASRAVVTDANGLPTQAVTTAAEIAFVNGVTSAIQTQLNAKQATLGYTAENTANKGAVSGYASLDGSGKVPAAQLPTLSSGTIATTSAVLKGDGAGNAIAATQTGSGNAVLATSPTLVTPVLGVATATSVNHWTLTDPGTAATLTAGADSLTYTLPEITTKIGFRHIPQNSRSANYTTVLNDSGYHVYHPAADANNRTITIDSHANVAYPIGTAIGFVNLSANTLSIAIATDIMYLAGTGTTGTRSLAQYGKATAWKVDVITGQGIWLISGVGLS